MEASRTSEEDKRQKPIALEDEYGMPIFKCVFSSSLALWEGLHGEDKSMKHTITTFALSAMLLALSFPADAQQPTKIPRIGYLVSRSAPGPNDQAFQEALHELGYVEGQNIVIERRWAGGNPDRVPDLAADLRIPGRESKLASGLRGLFLLHGLSP